MIRAIGISGLPLDIFSYVLDRCACHGRPLLHALLRRYAHGVWHVPYGSSNAVKALRSPAVSAANAHNCPQCHFQALTLTLTTTKNRTPTRTLTLTPAIASPCRVPKGTVDAALSYCHDNLADDTLQGLVPYLNEKGVKVVSASFSSMGLLTQKARARNSRNRRTNLIPMQPTG